MLASVSYLQSLKSAKNPSSFGLYGGNFLSDVLAEGCVFTNGDS